jgi:hypothetical protein
MAFGTSSKMFVATIEAALENAQAFNFSSDSIKIALFNNTISTPDATVALASTAFGAGVWAANEVFDGAEWPTGGQALDSVTSAFTSNVYKLDANDEVSTGTSATLADVRGCLVYDSTVSSYGICFLSFGGANAVTDGTFTVQFNASGIATITV